MTTAPGKRADALAPPAPKKCVIGEYCHTHGWIHGQEAEQLREGVEKILDEVDHEVEVADAANELDRRLRVMLDAVDARDSAAFVSARAINIEGSDGGPAPPRADAREAPRSENAKNDDEGSR